MPPADAPQGRRLAGAAKQYPCSVSVVQRTVSWRCLPTVCSSAAVAMAGKECVAIGSDLRFGVQLQTLATDYKKIYKIHDQLFIGLAGLGTDAQTL